MNDAALMLIKARGLLRCATALLECREMTETSTRIATECKDWVSAFDSRPLADLSDDSDDKARLDWLNSELRGVDFFTMDGQTESALARRFFQVNGAGLETARDDIRQAIDAARSSK